MTYRIKDEYVDLWCGNETASNIITEDELISIARGWDVSVASLMPQLEKLDETRISVDNGRNYVEPEEAITLMPWETIVAAMDDETREIVAQDAPDTELDFLREYLDIAPFDLVIG